MKSLLILFLILPGTAWSQLHFDFESGSLERWKQSRDSAWCISTANPLSGFSSLWHRLDDSLSGEDRISISYDSLEIEGSTTVWQFSLKHEYLPSSSNKWAVFLLCNRSEEYMRPDANADAIVLGINFKGSDDILKMWRMRRGKLEILAETSLNWQEDVGTETGRIKVERNHAGVYTVYTAAERMGPGPEQWTLIGSGIDSLEISPMYFGVYYRFSSRQDRKLWLDDISIQGRFIRDTIPPSIIRLKAIDEQTLRVEFSEPLDITTAVSEAGYSIIGEENIADTVFLQTSATIILVFKDPFESGATGTLRITGIKDRKENIAHVLNGDFTWFRAAAGDIKFNEIMYDPEPQVRLPGYEYIELYNGSEYTIDIEGWKISTDTRSVRLPQFEIQSGAHLLISYKGSSEQYPEAGLVLDALSSKTFLSNQGSVLSLFDHEGNLIDWMKYSPEMHADFYYTSGGWSLERIDPGRNCHAYDNWSTSRDRQGGSPGRANSLKRKNPDRVAPEIQSVYLADPQILFLEFNETMDESSLYHAADWKVGKSKFRAGGVSFLYPDSIEANHPYNCQLRLMYPYDFEPGVDYYLEPGTGIMDCSGNPIEAGSRYRFAIPRQPGRSDILITEVLFNPIPYCPDFIEIYNPGPAVFDLADIGLASRDPETAGIISATRIIQMHRLFYPMEYLVLTGDPESLSGCHTIHDPEVLIKVSSMPGMKDDAGSVLIINQFLEVIDEFKYQEDMHHPGLGSAEGVSLERISYKLPAIDPGNWHSASSLEGYATPGRKNSQFRETDPADEGFELDPEIFSPDLDGIEDILFIRYKFRSPGNCARIIVFDPRGRPVKIISGKELLGTEGFVTWDGTDSKGQPVRSGMYLVCADVSGKEGIVKYRLPCVISLKP